MTLTAKNLAALILVAACCASANDGWIPLFNGKDLDGWIPKI